jgi:N-acyl-D-aspartate/D-glutamate deacylase
MYGAISGRPAGILMSWQGSTHPFIGHPLWAELARMPWQQRLAKLKDPATKARLTSMHELAPSLENDSRMTYITQSFHKMFALGEVPDYEPAPETSVAAMAKATGRSELDVVYDILMQQDGQAMVYFPSFNYAHQNLDHIHKLMQHPNTMLSLADGGAHCHYICDVSMPTYMLTHWARDRTRGERLSLEHVVRRQSQDTARVYGLNDRGVLAPGMRADINVIDFDGLQLRSPYMAFDLPTGGKRLKQEADGYIATLVAGESIMENGTETGAMPGKLIRGPQTAS